MPADTQNPSELQLVDPVLTGLGNAYTPQGFVYDKVVTDLNVTLDTGLYPVWRREDLMRDDVETQVGPRQETPEVDIGYDTEHFSLKPYRLKVTIDPAERRQAHSSLQFERFKVEHLLNRMALRRERRLAEKLRKTSNGGALTLGAGVSTKWDAASGATIEKDIKAGRVAVFNATGQHVDTMILGWEVAYAMSLDASIREILKYTVDGQKIIVQGEEILPKTLHGLNVVIAGMDKFNAARKGAAEDIQSIWGDHVRLIKRARTDSWEPATAYAIRGKVDNNTQQASATSSGTSGAFLVDRWATPDPPVDHIRAWEKVQEHVTAADIAYEITDVLT